MSNVKQITIHGALPFDCADNEVIAKFLGQMNSPCCGLRISWGNCAMIPNKYGGETATYDFEIDGEEAIRSEWVELLEKSILLVGGKIEMIYVRDIENDIVLRDWNVSRLIS